MSAPYATALDISWKIVERLLDQGKIEFSVQEYLEDFSSRVGSKEDAEPVYEEIKNIVSHLGETFDLVVTMVEESVE